MTYKDSVIAPKVGDVVKGPFRSTLGTCIGVVTSIDLVGSSAQIEAQLQLCRIVDGERVLVIGVNGRSDTADSKALEKVL